IDLKFSELENPVYLQNGKNFLVSTKIKYLDNVSKTTSYFQYKLVLQKNGNWKIVDVK
ncbi:TPA: conjugal transfer protein, partial [Enterococcus faecium]